jgi:hypothetical protein
MLSKSTPAGNDLRSSGTLAFLRDCSLHLIAKLHVSMRGHDLLADLNKIVAGAELLDRHPRRGKNRRGSGSGAGCVRRGNTHSAGRGQHHGSPECRRSVLLVFLKPRKEFQRTPRPARIPAPFRRRQGLRSSGQSQESFRRRVADDVFAHSAQHHVLRPRVAHGQVNIRNVEPANGAHSRVSPQTYLRRTVGWSAQGVPRVA